MLNPRFKKKERTHSCENINAKGSKTNSYMKMCLFRCENMMVVFCVLFFLYEPMEKMVNSDSAVKYCKGWILNQGNWGDNKFREPKVVRLYLNGLLFCFNWSPAPNFDTRAGSSCHSCAAPWIARAGSLCLWRLIIKGGSVTLQSTGKLSASPEEQLHGGRAGNLKDKKHGLVSIWTQEASSPNAESWLVPVSMTFLQKVKLHLRESSPGQRSCECLCYHRCHVENWMEPWLLNSLSWN